MKRRRYTLEPLTCRCDHPEPDAIGQCSRCHRLVEATLTVPEPDATPWHTCAGRLL